MDVPYRIVIEPQEYDAYASVIAPEKILVLPFSNLGQGGIPARNWVWEHSISEGHARHWIMDDNIRRFARLNKNKPVEISGGVGFLAMEDFVSRYENVAMAGPQDYGFARCSEQQPPVVFNTRIYSCILIKNDLPYRWRGRYNEDTDLSLRALKDGNCTALFYAFLMDKTTTLKMKGGNTDELYKQTAEFDGRLEMAKSLKAQHPDVTEIVWKWNRWQHQVNYKPFKKNKLRRVEGLEVPQGVNNYGMVLKRKGEVVSNGSKIG